MSPRDPRAYIGLDLLYSKAGGKLFPKLEGYENGLQILKRYEQLDGEKYDISEFLQRAIESLEDRKGYERVQERHAQFEKDRKQPPAVLRSGELIRLYGKEDNPARLDEALDLGPEAVARDGEHWLWRLSKEIFWRNQAK